MTTPGSAPPEGVPTLTEVVAWPNSVATVPAPLEPVAEAMPLEAHQAASALPVISEEQLVQRVLADVQRQIDLMLEYRMREILAPILTRAGDSVVRETRSELASTLRDVVARAVAQELSRHRTR